MKSSIWSRWPRSPIVFVIVGAIVAIISIWWFANRQYNANRHGTGWTKAQMNALASIFTAQVQFKEACYVDQDADGIGEYGFLSELAGLDGRRTKNRQPTGLALIPPEMGSDALARGGPAIWEGLCFRVDLSSGHGLATAAPGAPPTAVGIDRQESFFLAYAWAAAGTYPGPTAVALPPDGTYRIRRFFELKHVYVGLEDSPAPGAALDPRPPDPPQGQSIVDARKWFQDSENTRRRQIDDLEYCESNFHEAGGDGVPWIIGSDGWVGIYGVPLDTSGWQRRLDALLASGRLPTPAPPLVLPVSPGAAPAEVVISSHTPQEATWLEIPLAEHFVLALDTSLSMGWTWPAMPRDALPKDATGATAWILIVHQIRHMLENLSDAQRFGIVLFNGKRWRDELSPATKANVEEAIQWIENVTIGGIHVIEMPSLAIVSACAMSNDLQQIVLFCDSAPMSGFNTSKSMTSALTCDSRIDLVLVDQRPLEEIFQPAIELSGGKIYLFP